MLGSSVELSENSGGIATSNQGTSAPQNKPVHWKKHCQKQSPLLLISLSQAWLRHFDCTISCGEVNCPRWSTKLYWDKIVLLDYRLNRLATIPIKEKYAWITIESMAERLKKARVIEEQQLSL